MRPTKLLMLFTLALAQPAFAKLEVHEWGTFTSLVGSNGVTQNGMYHEDEPLPDFVHGFGEIAALPTVPTPAPTPVPTPVRPRPCRFKGCFEPNLLQKNVITQKMETPVLYFYSDKTQDVSVNVKFPNGVVTETYPAPVATSPTRQTVSTLKNGDTTFKVQVLGPARTGFAPHEEDFIPYVDFTNIYSHARNVASNVVKSNNEREKFIFYRGVGQYQPKFSISSSQGDLSIHATMATVPQIAFLVDVDQSGHARLMELNRFDFLAYGGRLLDNMLSRDSIANLRDHARPDDSQIVSGAAANAKIVSGLMAAGLREDEAKAMVATWEHGYLKVPGLRLLSILQRSEVDAVLPLTISPMPDKIERAFVSRIEILLDTDEQQILKDIREKGYAFDVSSLGRFAEPKLRRVLEVSKDSFLTPVINTLIVRATNGNESSGTVSAQ